MLQIIGWILCLYLVVKACELLSMDTDEHKLSRPVATIGALLALVGAAVFFFLINEQAREPNKTQQQISASFSNLRL
ncbi:MAG: hypothetical protein ABI853_02645 [Sphingomicrobium sp.]